MRFPYLVFPLFLAPMIASAQANHGQHAPAYRSEPDGFQTTELSSAGGLHFVQLATLADGRYVTRTNFRVRLYAASGALIRVIGSSSEMSGRWMALSPDETRVLTSDGFGMLVLGDIQDGGLQLLPLGLEPDDAIFEDDGHVLLSHADAISRLALDTMGYETIGHGAGLTRDAAGNHYGIDNKANVILRWDAHLFHRPEGFTFEDGVPVASIDPAPLITSDSLAVSPEGRDFFYVTKGPASLGPVATRAVYRILHTSLQLDRTHGLGAVYVWVNGTIIFDWVDSLEFFPDEGAGIFAPYQPPGGGRLTFLHRQGHHTGFYNRFEVTPLRATISAIVPETEGADTADLDLRDGPPSGFGILATGQGQAVETIYDRGGLPFFWGLSPLAMDVLPELWALDSSGQVSRSYRTQATAHGVGVQVILLDFDLSLVGTTTPTSL